MRRLGQATFAAFCYLPADATILDIARKGDAPAMAVVRPDRLEADSVLTVTTLADHDDGSCDQVDCTLREAIAAANNLPGDKTIVFASGLVGVVQLATALPALRTNINLQGPGANQVTVRRNSSSTFRIFTISNGTTSGPTVTIGGLTIADGTETLGGGIYNGNGVLTINACHLTGNTASNTGGGGIYSTGLGSSASLAVNESTFSSNAATMGSGGAIYNYYALATLTNTTVSGNSAFNAGAVFNYGGDSGGTLNVHNCTFAANSSPNAASIYSFAFPGVPTGAHVTTRSSIYKASAQEANFINSGGSFISDGYNMTNENAVSFLSAATDMNGTDPLLEPLGDNGGPTPTHSLPINSPALDKGKSFGLALDQRGHLRIADSPVIPNAPGGDGADIGALEFHPLSGADSDGDGMSDNFETFYGFNPADPSDGALDSDGDGLTNAAEFVAGTNPRDASSSLRVTDVARSGNNLNIAFALAVLGKTYRLESKNAFSDSTWTMISDVVPGASGSSHFTHVGGINTGRRLYRVRVLP